MDYATLTWGNFFLHNLLPVTIGNIIGGAVGVGVVYYAIYLRRRSSMTGPEQASFSERSRLAEN